MLKALQRRFTITPLAIIRPEYSRTISGPWGYIHRCYQTIFPGAHGRNCPKPGTHLRLSEPRPTSGKQLAQGR